MWNENIGVFLLSGLLLLLQDTAIICVGGKCQNKRRTKQLLHGSARCFVHAFKIKR